MSCKYAPRGYAVFGTADLDEAKQSVKNSAGLVFGFHFGSTTANIRYVKIYDATAANTTVGTTTPKLRIQIPASGTTELYVEAGIRFDNGITIAAVTGAGDSSADAPGAGDVIATVLYA